MNLIFKKFFKNVVYINIILRFNYLYNLKSLRILISLGDWKLFLLKLKIVSRRIVKVLV